MQTEISFESVYAHYGADCEVKGVISYENIDGDRMVQTKEKSRLPAREQVQELIEAGARTLDLKLVVEGEITFCSFEAKELIKTEYSELRNRRMAEKLGQGEAINLSGCEKTKEGYYILDDFIEGKDYCDSKDENWIWSIGISYKSGQILASKSNVFYQNPDFECLFLR